jgi:hypothetical protein
MSQRFVHHHGRPKKRWSRVTGQAEAGTRSTAGLPSASAWLSVPPSFGASGLSLGSTFVKAKPLHELSLDIE